MLNSSDTMHDLPAGQAFLYWIPSMCVAIGMFITLLYSFWKFHKRKIFIRQLQMEYLELNLAAKRPRIGAIRCNTHGAKWEDLMASLNSSGYINMKNYLRQTSKLKSQRQYDIVYEENELSNNESEARLESSVKKPKTQRKEINPYYEQIGYVEREHKPKRSGSKKKKKKKPTLSLHSGMYHNANQEDNVEFAPRSSPRRLPVMENDLWSGYTHEHYQNINERQRPSIYYATRFVQSNDVERVVTPPKASPVAEHRRNRKEEKHGKHQKRDKHQHQEERVFWVLATDIMQSAV